MLHVPVKCTYASRALKLCAWCLLCAYQWSLLSPLSFVHSYKMVMQQCWLSDPDQRPKFSQLRAEIDGVLTAMAGYLDFSAIACCVDMDKANVCYAAITKQHNSDMSESINYCVSRFKVDGMILSQDAGAEKNSDNPCTQDKIFYLEESADSMSRRSSATPSGRKASIIAGISKQFSREGSSSSYTQFFDIN